MVITEGYIAKAKYFSKVTPVCFSLIHKGAVGPFVLKASKLRFLLLKTFQEMVLPFVFCGRAWTEYITCYVFERKQKTLNEPARRDGE
jgi:hypothetical protein